MSNRRMAGAGLMHRSARDSGDGDAVTVVEQLDNLLTEDGQNINTEDESPIETE